jgi:AcrR family transcriptional regulator
LARTKGARNADYEAKRRELLGRLLPRFADRTNGRPSFRQFAAAAGVTMPTLRHYFGDRSDVVAALLEEYHRLGERRLERVAQPAGDFETSIHEFAQEVVAGMQAANGPVRLGDVFSASLAEGLMDPEIGPLSLRYILDPGVEALERRLAAHIARGEMRPSDVRAAALALMSPILLAVLHQDQMEGSGERPIALPALALEVAAAFIRAYRTEPCEPAAAN